MKWKPDWFLIGMVVAVALAWIFPTPGAEGGWLHPELLTKAGVALIFFLNGVALPFERLKAGALRWPLHLVVQCCTFLLFPLFGFGLLWLGQGWLPPALLLGFFYLCALPSTVSTSVAMTSAARGNVAAAVFNATLSSLIGVFLTPFWIGLVQKSSGQAMPLGKVVLDLVIWLVLPLIAGQMARHWLSDWAARNKKTIYIVDRGTILLLIYTSFCDSVKRGVWSGPNTAVLLPTFLGVLILFLVVLFSSQAICDLLGFSFPDRIAAVFCGSKKSLATGIPMAQIIFAKNPALGLIVLPIMVYHPLQLVICGWLAGRWAKREES